jgi:alpha-1,2-mannosyltransferase
MPVRDDPAADAAPVAAIRTRPAWLAPVVLFAVVFAMYAATVQTSKVSVDVYSSSLTSWRIATTGSPWLEDVDTTRIDGYSDLDDDEVFLYEAVNGHLVSHRSPGAIAASLPAYALRGGGTAADDFGMYPQAVTAALLTAVTVLLYFLTLRRRLGDPTSLLAALVLGLTTPVWAVAANALWTHTVTILGIAGMAWAASRERWWLVGLFGGIALWGRLHVAVVVGVLGLGVALSRRRPHIALQVGLVSCLFLALACSWSHWLYGTWSPAGGYSTGRYVATAQSGTGNNIQDSPLVNQLGLWVSPDRGLLVWTPLLVLLLPALVRGWRELPDWSRWLLIGGVLYMAVQGRLNLYTGGGAFYSERLGLELLVAAAPAYALCAHRMGRVARVLIGPVIGLQAAAILIGATLDGPSPAESYGWTGNALAVGLGIAPVLGVLLVSGTVAGHLASRNIRRRQLLARPAHQA